MKSKKTASNKPDVFSKVEKEQKTKDKKVSKFDGRTFKFLAIIFGILFVVAFVYILVSNYQQGIVQEQQEIYIAGAQQGSQETVLYLLQQGSQCTPTPIVGQNTTMTMLPLECVYLQATTCEPFPLTFANQTVNMIAVECLQQGQPQQ
ncbi:hypothetical protein K9L67_00795 [Candidatus Woesearchaeota archaeon]|nr:hypothetical protein [Candidatus Woesearchaeota archaeon]MCF7900744.1 hypothetical protein [Candidatus Woesearchaeota archaeon]MCF8012909.1 hypothetical protein [Candidatus Woesearchaeota archaeon]